MLHCCIALHCQLTSQPVFTSVCVTNKIMRFSFCLSKGYSQNRDSAAAAARAGKTGAAKKVSNPPRLTIVVEHVFNSKFAPLSSLQFHSDFSPKCTFLLPPVLCSSSSDCVAMQVAKGLSSAPNKSTEFDDRSGGRESEVEMHLHVVNWSMEFRERARLTFFSPLKFYFRTDPTMDFSCSLGASNKPILRHN